MTLIKEFRDARRVATPIVAISTPDPRATMQQIAGVVDADTLLFRWDVATGLSAASPNAAPVLTQIHQTPKLVKSAAEVLNEPALKMPPGAILFVLNAHRFLEIAPVMQALWNLRDEFKANKRMIVLLGSDIKVPEELRYDILTINEALPDETQLREIITQIHADAGLDAPDEATMERAVAATSGLASFAAEQATAMSLKRTGLNLDSLWHRKREMIENTPGLSIWRGGETFSHIAGYDNVKGFLRRVIGGKRPPRVVVYIDEIEKALGASGGSHDTSGVSQSMLGTLLSWMQDSHATGNIFIGPPGTGKSAVAKATGQEAGVPTISFDLTGMKGSKVGESEQRLREALKIVDAVSGGDALVIATCNGISQLPPELRRRFKLGTFFFDLPDPEERRALWNLYGQVYELDPNDPAPPDEGWTGAEIAACCDNAHLFNCSLIEAAAYIVPVAISAKDQIDYLRNEASHRFISASYAGVYDRDRYALPAATGRTIMLEGEE